MRRPTEPPVATQSEASFSSQDFEDEQELHGRNWLHWIVVATVTCSDSSAAKRSLRDAARFVGGIWNTSFPKDR